MSLDLKPIKGRIRTVIESRGAHVPRKVTRRLTADGLERAADDIAALIEEVERLRELTQYEIRYLPSPEALDLRHAGHARILNSEDDHSTPDGAYVADEPVEEEG